MNPLQPTAFDKMLSNNIKHIEISLQTQLSNTLNSMRVIILLSILTDNWIRYTFEHRLLRPIKNSSKNFVIFMIAENAGDGRGHFNNPPPFWRLSGGSHA